MVSWEGGQGASSVRQVTPDEADVASKVYEYGGGAYCVIPGELVRIAYVEREDQRVWVTAPDTALPGAGGPGAISPVPPEGERWHHGDLCSTHDGRWVLAVRERHLGSDPVREVVAYRVDGDPATCMSVLCSGRQFFAAPRPAPDDRFLAWLSWDHPEMPWDATELWLSVLDRRKDSLSTGRPEQVAGGRTAGPAGEGVSVGQPLWCGSGRLAFVSDRTGWWQPWSCAVEVSTSSSGIGHTIEAAVPGRLVEEEAEFHGPDWVLGRRTLAALPDGRLALRRRRESVDSILVAGPGPGEVAEVDQPCVSIVDLCEHRGGIAWIGSTPGAGPSAWWAPATGEEFGPPVSVPIPPTRAGLVDPSKVSVAEPFTVQGQTGAVHGLYYPPSPGARPPPGSAPPLVVVCHGGPTSAAEAGFDPFVQLLTSHGMAVAAVDYGGSTGYGRRYRQRLYGQWGILDADDCAEAAVQLAKEGRADRGRMAIRGASAGGLTALCALARSSVFACGVSWYGVTDLAALAASTHDFESHYTQRLVGASDASERELERRSPVHLVTAIEVPVLIVQGLDDPIVPRSQAEAMVEALQGRGVRCEYLSFEGEGHGLRRAEHVAEALAAELELYEDVLWQP